MKSIARFLGMMTLLFVLGIGPSAQASEPTPATTVIRMSRADPDCSEFLLQVGLEYGGTYGAVCPAFAGYLVHRSEMENALKLKKEFDDLVLAKGFDDRAFQDKIDSLETRLDVKDEELNNLRRIVIESDNFVLYESPWFWGAVGLLAGGVAGYLIAN
jgi:hypothetical protein